MCGGNFSRRSRLNNHYEKFHNIQLIYENLVFESPEKFRQWWIELHSSSVCRFKRRFFKQNESSIFSRYCCQRPDCYELEDKRIQHLERLESKRLRFCCPAEIELTCSTTDQSCTVKYQKIHVAYRVETITEPKQETEEPEMKAAAVQLLFDDAKMQIGDGAIQVSDAIVILATKILVIRH